MVGADCGTDGAKPRAGSERTNFDNDIIAPYNGAKGGIANGPKGTGTSAPLFGDAGDADAGRRTRSQGTGAPETALDKNAGRNTQKTEQFGKVSYTDTETPDATSPDGRIFIVNGMDMQPIEVAEPRKKHTIL